MSDNVQRPVPVTDDPDTGGFFAAAARDELSICECGSCGTILHLPTPYCAECSAWQPVWRTVAPFGRLYSWTTVTQTMHAAFVAPYTLVLVALEDAPSVRLVGTMPDSAQPRIGMRLRAWFEQLDAGIKVPQWLPCGEGGST